MTSRVRSAAVFLVGLTLCGQVHAERLVLASASYGKNIVAICDAEGKLVWSHKTSGPKSGHAGHHDIQLLDNGNILYHDNWTTITEVTLGRKVVWTYDSSKMNGNQGKSVEVHAFQRLPNGLTMIAESGVGRIIEVDKDGAIQMEVKLQSGGRQNTRMVRKLPNGNYLVCAENPGVVTEYNARSEVVWEYLIKTRVYGAIRLKNGSTLIASGSGASVVEVSRDGKGVWEIKDAIPAARITLKWTTFLTELDNGNILVGNCHAGQMNPQIFEITRDKKVVWQFNQYATFGNGLACSQLLTDQQSALVHKQLANTDGKQGGDKPTAETELARVAAGMKPGTWVELKTANYTPELLKVQNGNILGYTDTAVWAPKTQQVLFVGQGHYAAVKFITYSAAANEWKLMPTPVWWKGDAKTGKGPIGHAYQNNTIDPERGILFHHQSATRVVHRYDITRDEWTTLPEIKDAATGHGTALAYFPERRGLVRVYGGAIHYFDEEKNTWSLLKDRFPMGPYHNIARYNAVDRSVIFGAGNSSKVLHRMDAQGNVTPLKEAPFIIRISSTVTAIDPVSGDLLVISSEDRGKFHALDVKKNEWRSLPDAPISEGASAPIEAHGVNLYFSNRPTKVHLYKHLK